MEAARPYCAQQTKCCCCQLPRYAKIGVCCVSVYLGLIPVVYLIGHFLIYPGSDWVSQLSTCEKFTFAGTTGQPIRAAHCLYGPAKNATPVVAFGGNGMNMYDSLESMDSIFPTMKLDESWDIYSISLPGGQYAPSHGWTTEGRAEQEAEALLDYVHNVTGKQVVVYGWSLGSSVAAALAAKSDAVQCVLLGNPFTSIRDVALSWTRNLAWPYLYVLDEWPTARRAKQFRAPAIVFSSTQDQVVPQEMHRKVYEAIPSQKKLLELPLEHMDISGFADAARDDIRKWCMAGGESLSASRQLTVAEVGVFHGHTTAVLAAVFHQVIAVDVEESYLRIASQHTNGSRNIVFVAGDSGVDRWHAFRSNHIDAVLIDADHRYESVRTDVENALRVKTVKYFAFHDYAAFPGVRRAIEEFEERGALVKCQAIGSGWDGSTWFYNDRDPSTQTNLSEGRLCRRGKLSSLAPSFVNKAFYIFTHPIDDLQRKMDCQFLATGRMICSALQGVWSFLDAGRRLQVKLDGPSQEDFPIFFNKDHTAFIMGPYLGETYFGLQEGLAFMALHQANRLFKDAKRQPL
ncbi:abhd13 [Symbiodinium natans]|uniref:Abhd13 protein n=1 Tax=Symbiodinium natans TaxID=878477 RepID=A0A812LEX1_9DINO|nr:abhd13 [Symbiodinium natans]